MKYLKLLFKISIGIVGIFIILIFVLLNAESYETITKKNGNEIEIKKIFGKKISESAVNADGFYHGPSKSWYIFKSALKSEGNYKNGYWDGLWRDYDRNGKLMMRREFDMGVPIKIFIPAEKKFKELSKDEWPNHLEFKQRSPQRVHEK
jgi:antitoxin component YwqK of YwqJK toxin-antitoxin module